MDIHTTEIILIYFFKIRLYEEITVCLSAKTVVCQGGHIEFVSKSFWFAKLKTLGIKCTACQVEKVSKCVYGFKEIIATSDIGVICK